MTSPRRRPSARRASRAPSGEPSVPPGDNTTAAAAKPTEPQIRDGLLYLGDRQVPLWSGALHYFRLAPEAWIPALASLDQLGLNIVESYVPWSVHELDATDTAGARNYDFGQHNPSLNLSAFLSRVHEAGMLAFLRPGPHINAELTHFGLPDRIVHDSAMWARSANQQPVPLVAPPHMFAVPSCASSRFREETHAWFQTVAEQVRPHLWPKGPVVLMQVDNEAAFYFRDGPYDQDYHPEALRFHRARLRGRHNTDERLSEAYGIATTFETNAPPTRCQADTPQQLMPALDWVHSQEELILDSLHDMSESLRRVGLGEVPFVHNLPMGDFGLPTNVASVDRVVGLAGLDYYQTRTDFDVIKRRTLRLCGSVETAFAPELGAGAPPWFVPRTNDDSLFTALCALAFGLRGLNLYMAVARDRWYGAPIDVHGNPRPSSAAWRNLFHALHETQFATLQRNARIGLVLPRHYARLSRATHKLGAMSPSVLDLSGIPAFSACARDDFGFAQPIQLSWWRWLDTWAKALDAASIPFTYIDDDARAERFATLDTLVIPTYETFATESFARLKQLAHNKRVYVGPLQPHLDEQMRERRFDAFGGPDSSCLITESDVSSIVSNLAAAHTHPSGLRLDATPQATSNARMELTIHHTRGKASDARVLFVIAPDATATDAILQTPTALFLRDALSGERFAGQSSVTVPMRPRSCRMLIVEAAP